MSDVTEEGIGLRSFLLRKERASERAIEKIRHHIGHDWQNLTIKEIDKLSWALGETWATMSYHSWETIQFSAMDLAAVKKVIDIADEVVEHKKLGSAGFEEIHNLLSSL